MPSPPPEVLGALPPSLHLSNISSPRLGLLALGAPATVDSRHSSQASDDHCMAWHAGPDRQVTAEYASADSRCDGLVADPHSKHRSPCQCQAIAEKSSARAPPIRAYTSSRHFAHTWAASHLRPFGQARRPDDWPAGLHRPCHGSTYDLAGRVFKDMPASQKPDLPRFMFRASATIVKATTNTEKPGKGDPLVLARRSPLSSATRRRKWYVSCL